VILASAWGREPGGIAGHIGTVGLVLLCCAWPRDAAAYRPFDSTDAAVVDSGEMEIEFGPLGSLHEDDTRSLIAPEARINWGFAPRWECVLEGRNLVTRGSEPDLAHDRVEETALSVKSVLRDGALQGSAGPSVAMELGVLLPTIHGEPGSGASAALILSKRWSLATLHLNGAATVERSGRPGFFSGAILEGPAAWKVRPAAEVLAEGERSTPTERAGLVAAIWTAREGLAFDAAYRFARQDGVSSREVRAGLTWDFPVKRRH
jgi:hypothetical protein